MSKTPQQRAADTRARIKAEHDLYLNYSKPAHDKVEKVLNQLLAANDVRVRFVGNGRLKKGVTGARLIGINHGGLGFIVHVDGYAGTKHYASSFWEIA